MKKRKWALIRNPKHYDIKCSLCRGTHIEWSEFEGLIWCYDCKKDVKGTPSALNGLAGVTVARMLGCPPDEVNLKTRRIRIPEQKKTMSLGEYREFRKRKD